MLSPGLTDCDHSEDVRNCYMYVLVSVTVYKTHTRMHYVQIRINECIEITPAVCSHNCTNTRGSYNCSCRIDYQLNATDSSSCVLETVMVNVIIIIVY